jgi:hypothetical protein
MNLYVSVSFFSGKMNDTFFDNARKTIGRCANGAADADRMRQRRIDNLLSQVRFIISTEFDYFG